MMFGLRNFYRSHLSAYARLQKSGRVVLGDFSYGYPEVRTFDHDATRLLIGKYTSIAKGVIFNLGGEHPLDRVTVFPLRLRLGLDGAGEDGFPCSRGDVTVGSDVWIGAEAMILSGVNIGHGAVVAAGAVVVRDVMPFAVVGGVPARQIGERFNQDLSTRLLEIAWWDWPEEVVRSHAGVLSSGDVQAFVDEHAQCGSAPQMCPRG